MSRLIYFIVLFAELFELSPRTFTGPSISISGYHRGHPAESRWPQMASHARSTTCLAGVIPRPSRPTCADYTLPISVRSIDSCKDTSLNSGSTVTSATTTLFGALSHRLSMRY